MIDLTEEQIERYSRHILLQDVGLEGQEKILNAKVLIIGAGGLGAPAALYLAAAGVGTIGIVDADNVDLSNLQRQVIHFTKDVGKPKVESAKEKMLAINPDIKVNAIKEFQRHQGDHQNYFPRQRQRPEFLIDACMIRRIHYGTPASAPPPPPRPPLLRWEFQSRHPPGAPPSLSKPESSSSPVCSAPSRPLRR